MEMGGTVEVRAPQSVMNMEKRIVAGLSNMEKRIVAGLSNTHAICAYLHVSLDEHVRVRVD